MGRSRYSDSEEEEDNGQKLYPIGYYIDDREEMIEQMFSVVKRQKLEGMLKSSMKGVDVCELKADCLIQLLGMSKKRILTILEGGECSSSEVESDNSLYSGQKKRLDARSPKRPSPRRSRSLESVIGAREKKIIGSTDDEKPKLTPKQDQTKPRIAVKLHPKRELIPSVVMNKKQAPEPTVKSEDPKNATTDKNPEVSNEKQSKQSVKKAGKEKSSKKKEKKSKTNVKKKKAVKHKGEKKAKKEDKPAKKRKKEVTKETAVEVPPVVAAAEEGVNLLEILELEMRAEAIRALLQNQDDEDLDVKAELLGLNDIPAIEPEKSPKEKKTKKKKKVAPKKKRATHSCSSSSSGSSSDNASESSLEVDDDSPNRKKRKISEDGPSPAVPQAPVPMSRSQDISSQSEQAQITEPTWGERWLESKNVKQVVATSKICANIRKRMRMARMAKIQENSDTADKKEVQAQQSINAATGHITTKVLTLTSLEERRANENPYFKKPSRTSLEEQRANENPYFKKVSLPSLEEQRANESPYFKNASHTSLEEQRANENPYFKKVSLPSLEEQRANERPYFKNASHTSLEEQRANEHLYFKTASHTSLEEQRANENPYFKKPSHKYANGTNCLITLVDN